MTKNQLNQWSTLDGCPTTALAHAPGRAHSNRTCAAADPHFEGEYTPSSALDQLLAHTGLHYEYLDAKTVAVLGPRADTNATARRISALVSQAIQNASQGTGRVPDRF